MAVKFNATQIRDRAREATMRGIIRGTEEVRNEAVSLIMNSPASGRLYQRRGVTHKASAPGEPPASDTGELVNGIETEYNEAQLSGAVVSRAPHGPHLEYGTENMEPRPYLRPALANKKGQVEKYIREELLKEFK